MISLPRFGVSKPVPVRLLMMAILIAGAYSALTMRREFFPQIDPDEVRVIMPYPGATPQEVEESMVRKVEDAVANIEEVDEIKTTVSEGVGSMMVKFRSGVTISKGRDKVQQEIDLLTDLPDEAEQIHVTEFEPQIPAIMLTLYGDAEETVMKQSARRMADDLRSLPGMGEILLSGVREYEVRVDVDQAALLEHGISLPQISDAISAWMRDVPGGAVRTSTGNINVRTLGVPERAEAIRQIVVRADAKGQALRVRDIAVVSENFVDSQLERRFNGKPAVSLTIFKKGDQDAIDISGMVKAYAAGRRGESITPNWRERVFGSSRLKALELGAQHSETLPGKLQTHSELSRLIQGRLDLLTSNAFQGAGLIFLTILLVLNFRTAFWVMSGLTVAICGTLALMNLFDVTLNLITMFGLLITLGMLEDDAIVVSENVIARYEKGEPPMPAAVKGAEQVFWPVLGTVLTTIVAFVPLALVRGRIGDLLGALPWVVLFSLIVSVIETMTMLPSHMAHALEKRARNEPGPIARRFRQFESWRDRVIIGGVIRAYGRMLEKALEYRYVTTCIAIAVLIISMGMVAGGRCEFTFLPKSDAESFIVDLRMPIGTSLADTEAAVARIEKAAQAQPELVSVGATVGEMMDLVTGVPDGGASHLGQIFIELTAVESRTRESPQVIGAIRKALGDTSDIESLRFTELSGGPGGPDITYQVVGEDDESVGIVVEQLKTMLAKFDGLHDITDDKYDGQREVQIELKSGAAALGLTVSDVARQVRGALYGLEPHVFSAKREDIKVRVRLDEQARRNLNSIENLWVITATGQRVPLMEIATLHDGRSYSSIRRINRQRAVNVTSDTAVTTNPEMVTQKMADDVNRLRREHTTVGIEVAGRQKDLAEAFETLPLAFLAALSMIYLILAWLFSSYIQPLTVMLAIPFGIIGVVWGHMLLGYQLTFLSLIGFVALTGVVVNNSLILIEFYNHKRAAGMPLRPALIAAGRERLRAITLTSITTFFGLMPLVLEQSFQAKFLIPMAISICFGLLSATVLTLTVLPAFMVIVDDLKRAAYFLWHGLPRPETSPQSTQELTVRAMSE